MTWNEFYERIARTLGKRRGKLHIPVSLARAGAVMTELLPSPPLTRDQLTMLEARRQRRRPGARVRRIRHRADLARRAAAPRDLM